MISVHSDIIQYKGSHYNFGYMQGKQLRNSPILAHRKKLWGPRKNRHFLINKRAFKKIIHSFFPSMWNEIVGLADGLKCSIEEAIIEFGGYYLEYGKSGCSIFTTEQYMVRNYDNHPETYEGRYVIYEPTDHGYTTVGPSMQITGRTDGMNEKGLVMGYNFINRKKSDDGFLCNMIGRMILELCADVDEAISLLKEIPHRHSFSYVLLDPFHKPLIVEASPRRVSVREGSICTNHFKHLTEENRYRMDDSKAREDTMNMKQKHIHDPLNAFKLLNDPNQGVFSRKYGAYAGTLHTAIYLPSERKAGIALGENKYPLIFNIDELLKQKHIRAKRIKGRIRANMPFINE